MKARASIDVFLANDETPEDRAGAGTRARMFYTLLTVSFVFVFTLVALGTIKEKSPTIDEPIHVLAGYSYLNWGDYRVNPEHPPLAKILAALPLLGLEIKDPRPSAPEWNQIPKQRPGIPTAKVAAEMFFVKNDAETLFFYGKFPFVLVGLILGMAVFLWAKEWFGLAAGATALILFLTNPTIMAHSTIVHTDLPFTALFFLGTYFFQRSLRSQSWSNGLLTCILFGMAAITKFSAVGIFITWSVIGLIWIFKGDSPHTAGVFSQQRKFVLVSVILAGMTVAAFGLIWAAYGFRFAAIPEAEEPWSLASVMPPNSSAGLQGLVSFVAGFHLLPEAWIYGQLYNLTYLHRTAFLLGDFSSNGFWLYFPVAFLTKTPVPALVLIAVAIGSLCTVSERNKIESYILWIPVVVYFTLAVWARMNIGVRHILPIFPFLFVLAGASAARLWTSGARWMKGCLLLLGVWAFWNLVATYPNYLSFFNELAGGSKNGHKILVDSNLDWGQDLKGLKAWMDKQAIKKILLLYFGTAEPAYYGIDAVAIPGGVLPPRLTMTTTPGVPYTLAISANHFYAGRIYSTPSEQAMIKSLGLKQPEAVIGHSILVFNLDRSDPQVNLSLGTILAMRGDWSLAEESLRKVLSTPQLAPVAQEILARVLAREGKDTGSAYHHNQARTVQRSPGAGMGLDKTSNGR
jgi:hypothetical protein